MSQHGQNRTEWNGNNVLKSRLSAACVFVAIQVYRILLRHSPVVQPLSVDEAFLDLTSLGLNDNMDEVQQLVGRVRAEIQTTTGCTASAGGQAHALGE